LSEGGFRRGLRRPKRPGTWTQRIAIGLSRDVPLVLLDGLVVFVSFLAALVVRFEGAVPTHYWRNFWLAIPVAVIGYLYLNFTFGLYGQMWRYASIREARRVIASGLIMGLWLVASSVLLGGTLHILPLSVVALGAVFSLLGLGVIRFQSRLFAIRRRIAQEEGTRILVVGAGDAGEMLVRDILRRPESGLVPVGFVDDDPKKVGRRLHGLTVLGNRTRIPELCARHGVGQVLLAVPSATSDVVREFTGLCEEAEVGLRVLPPLREVVGHRVTARDIRDLRIEDLLGVAARSGRRSPARYSSWSHRGSSCWIGTRSISTMP
jgi:FlaA1/EpsC-like NDP-sugar epimerase